MHRGAWGIPAGWEEGGAWGNNLGHFRPVRVNITNGHAATGWMPRNCLSTTFKYPRHLLRTYMIYHKFGLFFFIKFFRKNVFSPSFFYIKESKVND